MQHQTIIVALLASLSNIFIIMYLFDITYFFYELDQIN